MRRKMTLLSMPVMLEKCRGCCREVISDEIFEIKSFSAEKSPPCAKRVTSVGANIITADRNVISTGINVITTGKNTISGNNILCHISQNG